MAELGERRALIHALVVDDEALARRNLMVLLESDPDVGRITECDSGLAALEQIGRCKPDLVFLDVQMPECGGFDVLEMLGSDAPKAIIFVTAYDEYALRAIEVGALDYLLKPFDDAGFVRALGRAKDKIAHHARPQQKSRRLAVRSIGRLLFIDVSDIDWIEAASYYSCVHVGRETHLIRRTMSELERDLVGEKFIRIHRSTIVNIDRIRGLEIQPSGEYAVVLGDGVQLRLSRRYKKRLQDRLGATGLGASAL